MLCYLLVSDTVPFYINNGFSSAHVSCSVYHMLVWLRDGRWRDAHVPRGVRIPSVPHGRPRRINTRNSRASESKASSSLECSAERSLESTKLTFCCVDNHEQPLVGASLFARTGPAGQALNPFPDPKPLIFKIFNFLIFNF